VYSDVTKLTRIGNSQGVRLPAALIKKILRLEVGVEFDLEVFQKYGAFGILLTPRVGVIDREEVEK